MERKSLLNKSKIEYVDYNCNYYEGCEHGCLYPCYARLMSYKRYEDWIRPEAVTNALELLKCEVERKPPGRVMICSMTDPYQPINRRYGLTRKIVKILLDRGFEILIQTKSADVLADIDLFNDMVTVGMTVVTLSEQARRRFEPFASPIGLRLAALRILKGSGVRTRISLEPILPGTRFEEISKILSLDFVDEWWVGILSHTKTDPNYHRNLERFMIAKIEQLGTTDRVHFKQEISAFPI